MDPETGKCIFTKDQLATPLKALKAAMKDVQDGKFNPDRENDERHAPSGMLNTVDEHEAHQAPFYGRLGFSTAVTLIEAEGEKRNNVQTGYSR